MSRRLIDLSVPVLDGPSEATPVEVEVLDHRAAPAALGLRPEDFPEGEAISNETVTLTTHTGTHLDAPLHYGLVSGGEQAAAVDAVPLDWCLAPGVRLDLRHIPPGVGITADDVRDGLAKIDHELQPGDIVLIWTGADRLWGTDAYRTHFPGMTRESTAYLVERGVKIIGIDAWGFDRPFASMLADYRRHGDNRALWPAHLYGREQPYCQLEKLANLGALPGDTGFTVVCFPVKLAGLGAGWTRVVAVVDGS
ncbi:cyclase family protein [Micromonospora rifamycinica]|uniref:Kynurenine formamidase n=1 Tax=Micromonospora rifamycinica TaxID=291594 RepID=A0A120F9N8_9ACTN|nr:cyclase family protein [Micromonospora rifamycinica]KWV33651.1 cyclase [Micromonospora rifamycinica]SCG47033.1 Kynurenine formamidase [Micromonospora rifamycinica]